MGVDISRLVEKEDISFGELSGKRIAIDVYVMLYQFLKTMPLLTDRSGMVTTHLSGLFYRTMHLLQHRIKPCFVFDGSFPEVKGHGRFARPGTPRITATITKDVVASTKELVAAMGLPIVQAPTEAEAQAAYICSKKDVWAVASQDYDTLVFGAPRLIQNVTIARRKKTVSGFVYIAPYLIELERFLAKHNIKQDQLIALAMLVGTDFNPGVRGIGQVRALNLVKSYGCDFDALFGAVGWDFEYDWEDVFRLLKTMPVTREYKLMWKCLDAERVQEFLVEKHDFSRERVENALKKLRGIRRS